jgi:hypothetical protein
MFINKWRVIDSIQKLRSAGNGAGISYPISMLVEPSLVLKCLQEHLWDTPFTILFSQDISYPQEHLQSLADNMIRFFFQPSYYTYDLRPVVFVGKINLVVADFLELVNQKCRLQGLKEIKVYELQPGGFGLASLTNTGDIDLSNLTRLWQKQYFDGKDPSEIHIVVAPSSNQNEILEGLAEIEGKLHNTKEYAEAEFLYHKQREIEECRHQLYLRSVSENNTQLYLSIQKEERANGLKWYYHEYEILPVWYKKFGHIIKVLMGKRSFKSLFSDKVKKYKD